MNTPTILMILFTAFLLVYIFYLGVKFDRLKSRYNLLIKAHTVDIQVFTRFVNDKGLIDDYADFYDELIKKEVKNG